MVRIEVNLAHPMFAEFLPTTEVLADGVTVGVKDNTKHVKICVGTLDDPSLFYNFNTYNQTNSNVGDCGTNYRILEVSPSRPMVFESNYDFALLGNINDTYQAGRALASLTNLVRDGVLLFYKDGALQTADQVIQFTP